MGCCHSKADDPSDSYTTKSRAGILLAIGKFPEPIVEEERPVSPPKDRPFSLFGALPTGFGPFETMFTKKAVKKPKQYFDMTIVYQVPRDKLNINPFDTEPAPYHVREKKVATDDSNLAAKYLLTMFGHH